MHRLAAVLLLAGCAASDTSMTMSPTLHCERQWRCNVIGWTLGIPQGPKLAGIHGGCRCIVPDK